MNQLFSKIGIKGSLRKNFGAIVILAFTGSVIFGLPFFRFEYYDAYISTYHLTNTQMGVFGTVIGVFGIISYLFGGVVADGMSVKKIIVLSPIVTGLGGLLHLLPLGFGGLLGIYALWGISTTFAFWPACVKAVRVMSDEDSQGKAYGFFEGMQSVAGAFTSLAAVGFFNWGTSGAGNEILAMKYVILFYSFVNIAMGIVALYTVEDDKIVLDADKVSFKGIKKVLKNPAVWIICLVSFCNHVFCLSIYYYIPYVTDILGAAVAFGAMMGVLRKFGSIGGNIAGGYLADKFGTGKLMLTAYIVMLAGQIAIFFVPAGAAVSAVIVTILFVTIMGYRYFFLFLTAIIAIGLVLILIWKAYLKHANIDKSKMDEKAMEELKQYV